MATEVIVINGQPDTKVNAVPPVNATIVGDVETSIAFASDNSYSSLNKFGRRIDVDKTDLPATIWDGPANRIQLPLSGQTHSLVSSSASDVGVELYSGSLTADGVVGGNGVVTLTDSAASFITDGVSSGDTIINLANVDHSVVVKVISETVIEIFPPHHGTVAEAGIPFKIVTSLGIGCGVVHLVKCLNEDMEEVSEFVLLNGITPVQTVNKYTRINRMHADHNGSNKSNVGNITATADIEGTVSSHILAGQNQTNMAVATVPAGHEAILRSMYISLNRIKSTSGAMGSFSLMTNKFAPLLPIGLTAIFTVSAAVDGSSYIQHEFSPPILLEGRTDVMLMCTDASDNNLIIDAGFDLVIKHLEEE